MVTITGNNMRTSLPKAQNVTNMIVSPVINDGGVQQVNDPSRTFELLNKRWTMTRALIEGTDAMRKASEKFLPKEPKESTKAYANRLARSVLFNAYDKTVKTATGRPFSRHIIFDGMSPRLQEFNENIDLQGNNINVFARHSFLSGIAHGHSFVMVDHPKRPVSGDNIPSLEDERERNLRPFWRKIDPYDVIGWRSVIVDGIEKPIQVRIRETATKPVGMFGEKNVQRVRVLEPGNFRLYELRDSGEWELEDTGQFIKANGDILNKIPIIPFYSTLRNGFYKTTPTLIDLAFMNVLHWQSSSDQENILHVARIPILFGTGFLDDDDMEIGSSRWIKGPDGSTLVYVEHSGKAIESGRESLEDLENRMRIMGAEILVRDPARITATQKVLDTDEATSELQDTVSRYEDFLQQCYALTAEWIGEDETATGTVDIFKDFGISAKAVDEARELLQTRLAKQITQERFLIEIQRRGLLADDTDIDAEIVLTTQEQDAVREQMLEDMQSNSEDEDE